MAGFSSSNIINPGTVSNLGVINPAYTPEAATANANAMLQQSASTQEDAGAEEVERAQIAADYDARRQQQVQFEKDNGVLGTIALQTGRGLIDGLMAPGALVGVGAESAGAAFGWETLQDFGRDLGEAASGKSAMEAAAFLFGGGGSTGLSYADQTIQKIQEQEQAHPMLSSVSRLSGQALFALGTGGAGAAAAGTSLGARALAGAAVGAVEGGGAGAQSAYEQSAPLRDVLSSSVPEAGAGARYKVSIEEAGGPEAAESITELMRARQYVDDAVKKAGDNPTTRATAEETAKWEAVQNLVKKAGGYNPDEWGAKAPSGLQKVVFRRPILDKVSADLSAEAVAASKARPGADFDISPSRLGRLTKDADGPLAIGTLQTRVKDIIAETPSTPAAFAARQTLRKAQTALGKAELPEAMAAGHALVRQLGEAASSATDDATRGFLQRAATSLADDLGSEPFGSAGKLYASTRVKPSEGFTALSDPKLVRDALRTSEFRGRLAGLVREHNDGVAAAFDARRALSGEALPKDMTKSLAALEKKFLRGEDAVTLDGGPAGRVLGFFREMGEDRMLGTVGSIVGGSMGGIPGAILGNIVANTLRPQLKKVLPSLVGDLGGVAAKGVAAVSPLASVGGHVSAAMSGRFVGPDDDEDPQEVNDKRLERLATLASTNEPAAMEQAFKRLPRMSPEATALIGEDYGQRVQTLLGDLHKPDTDVRGKAYETLSSEQLRQNTAMWEATTAPMSIFDDFEAGTVDYDKVSYAWKQYPGLKQAAQAGLIDMMSSLEEQDRETLPDSNLTQLDFLFGFDGALQSSVEAGFCDRMSRVGAEGREEEGGNARGQQLNLPTASPSSLTERLASR